jgi:transcriptional regulator with XRE-family HTH domain
MAQVKKTEEYGGLRRIMAERGLCGHEVAALAGVGNATVNRVLNGTYVFWDRTERKVEKALGVGPGELRGTADESLRANWPRRRESNTARQFRIAARTFAAARRHLETAMSLLAKLDAGHADKARRKK